MLVSRSNNTTSTGSVNGVKKSVVVSASTQEVNKLAYTKLYAQMYGFSLIFRQQNQILGLRPLDTVRYSHRLLLHPGAPLNLKDYHIFYWKTVFSQIQGLDISLWEFLFPAEKMVSLFSRNNFCSWQRVEPGLLIFSEMWRCALCTRSERTTCCYYDMKETRERKDGRWRRSWSQM